ncbi:hypothetical protein F4781DRAFT_307930 [Annulohypoxylon bovei var. microspora]|nr:hypothetical protein F4781DRAFT_307930 [Annulohypoxylon bovei var. microspora]
MAEALTLIGGLAAIMELSGTMVKLTRDLRVCVNTIRSAPKEIESFILETSIFTDLLCYFHNLTKEFANKLDQKFEATRAGLVRKIARQCELVKEGFAHLVARFVEINDPNLVPFNTFWVRIIWLWRKPDVPELRLSIQSATANVSLLSNCFKLEETIRKNGNDDEIKMLKKMLKNCVSTAKKLRHELAEHQRRKHPSGTWSEIDRDKSYNISMKGSRQLERYAIDALKSYTLEAPLESRRSSRRKSSRQEPPRHMRQESRVSARSAPASGGNSTEVYDEGSIRHKRHQTSSQNTYDEKIHTSNAPHSEILSHGLETGRIREKRSQSRIVEQTPQTPIQPHIEESQQKDNIVEPSHREADSSETAHENDPQVEKRSERKGPSVVSVAELDRSQNSRNSLEEDIPGPYKPMAPFGGPGSRRRPRRPRPQSPID